MGKPATLVDPSFAQSNFQPVYNVPAIVDTVLSTSGNQTGLVSADLPVGAYQSLAIDFNLTSITGGTSPTFNVVTKRKGADGIYYTVDTPTALTAIGAISRSLGPGCTQGVEFGATIQVSVVVTGAPTGAAWTLSIQGRQAV